MIKRTYQVKGMHCLNCAMHLENLSEELPGIVSISASYQKMKMEIEFDETIIEEEKIIQAAKEIGYELIK